MGSDARSKKRKKRRKEKSMKVRRVRSREKRAKPSDVESHRTTTFPHGSTTRLLP
jgi:hypothetical protein